DGHDAASRGTGRLYKGDRLRRNAIAFRVHDVVVQVFSADRLEGTCADMQCDKCLGDALGGKLSQHGFVEVQACSGRCDGTGFASVYRLIALVVVLKSGMLYIGW